MTVPVHPSELPAIVAQMRALGVTRFGDIELGPDPNARPDDKGDTQRTAEAEMANIQRVQRLKFGASGGPRPRAVR